MNAALLDQGDIADLAIEDLRKWKAVEALDQVLALNGRPSHNIPIVHRAFFRRSPVFTHRAEAPPTMVVPLATTAAIGLVLGLGDVPARLEALGALAGLDDHALARQAASAIGLVIHVERTASGDRRIAGVGRPVVVTAGRLAIEALRWAA